MRRSLILSIVFTVALLSCKKDDAVSCTTCSSPQTLNFELCSESNGDASVNGEDTDIDYEIYLASLKKDGVECGR